MRDRAPRLRILTWNVHRGVGLDGRFDLDRVGAAVTAMKPDIAAFQEVAWRRRPVARSRVHHVLREHIGDYAQEAWSITSDDGQYGQMLASRYPLDTTKVHDISVARREPRYALEAIAETPLGPVRVIATHLGFKRWERRWQLDKLYEIVRAKAKIATVVMGDLNEWRPGRVARHPLFAAFDTVTGHRSFPSILPVLSLDRIFVRAAGVTVVSRVHKAAGRASDHLPVIAELFRKGG